MYIFLFELAIIFVGILYFKKGNVYLNSLVTSALFVLGFSVVIFNPYPARHFGEFIVFSYLILAVLTNLISLRWLKVLYLVSAIYLLNNFAGDAYIIYKKYKNTSYDKLTTQIDQAIPDKTVVVSLLEFWFPLKENVNYNQYTRWIDSPFSDLDELLNSNTVQYVVISDYMVSGITGTSGRKKYVPEKDKIFYNKVTQLTIKMGTLVKEIPTDNYGIIKIWKIGN
ncbi:MAG: hypothetical protein HC905_02035 [Bacteroidales bacterium]|nr:hypothetical protein [Bacteroidales bacterium]